jgi:hypothetical protein
MIIIGVDYHPSFQQISFLDQETGECGDRRLNHSDGEAERFYVECFRIRHDLAYPPTRAIRVSAQPADRRVSRASPVYNKPAERHR